MRLAIIGASGHGKVVADAAELNGWQEVVFFDDAWPGVGVNGPWQVEGTTSDYLSRLNSFEGVVVAIGSNKIRAAIQHRITQAGGELVSIIHPTAVVSRHAEVLAGTVVLANAVVNPSATIGMGCIVNTGAVVEHDCDVGAFSHLSPNAVLAGGVAIGEQVWIGAGALVKQLVAIGNHVTVGMGSVVLADVGSGNTVAGVPARLLG